MRKKFIAGNWKMNLNGAAAESLTKELSAALKKDKLESYADIAVCPPSVYLTTVAAVLKGSVIALGAQDVFYEKNGAFTGEISAEMLKDIGCRYVIIGHSERRHIIGESDQLINKKLRAALAAGLEPILCIGELLEERESGRTEAVIEQQLRQDLVDLDKAALARLTIAYEPVWAIGTGKTATAQQAQEAHAFARGVLTDIFDDSIARQTRIQYGGSVKPANAAELIGQKDVDGALVGGASLKVDDFVGIIKAGCGLEHK